MNIVLILALVRVLGLLPLAGFAGYWIRKNGGSGLRAMLASLVLTLPDVAFALWQPLVKDTLDLSRFGLLEPHMIQISALLYIVAGQMGFSFYPRLKNETTGTKNPHTA